MTDFVQKRIAMVDTQVRPSDVTKFPIIDAMLTIAREQFIPDKFKSIAYVGDHINLSKNLLQIFLLKTRSLRQE